VVRCVKRAPEAYSASDVAREEFPDLELTVRARSSIARAPADPLAELVKVDPKASGWAIPHRRFSHLASSAMKGGELREKSGASS